MGSIPKILSIACLSIRHPDLVVVNVHPAAVLLKDRISGSTLASIRNLKLCKTNIEKKTANPNAANIIQALKLAPDCMYFDYLLFGPKKIVVLFIVFHGNLKTHFKKLLTNKAI